MIRALALAMLAASPALAQPTVPMGPQPRSTAMAFEETGADEIGILRVFNGDDYGAFPRDVALITVETSRGPLRLSHTTTQNNLCSPWCPDRLEAVETPPGTVLLPPILDLDEGAEGVMRLVEWSGM